MNKISKFTTVFLIALSIFSCQKDNETTPGKTPLKINISHQIDNLPLIFDSIMYTNDAGELYEINRLEYYISNITIHRSNGESYTSNKIFYINAITPSANSILLDSIPIGKYNQITFNIGLDSIQNISNNLPNTSQNINMAWPLMMGGAYHFMKLEGHYKNGGNDLGYAIHLGKNDNLVSCVISGDYSMRYPNPELTLSMNINEWFRSPTPYSFVADGNYTMSQPLLMKKIADNGYNAFSLK